MIPAPPVRHRRKVAAVGAVAVASTLVAAVPATAAPRTASAAPPIGARIQAILDQGVQAPAGFPGIALRVRFPDGRTWSGAAGRMRVDRPAPMRADARFRAGSIMKPFVAAATLQLVEEGRIRLGDRLPAVLPRRIIARFPQARRITVRMLLDHTSGLGDYTTPPDFDRAVAADPRRHWTLGELLDRAAAIPATGAPGERFSYTNTGYNLLGAILERVTGKPWRTVVRERVIDRLHLAHTSLPEPGTVPRGRDIAHAYQDVDGTVHDFTDVDSSMAGAAGGHALLTTTKDLSRFLDALFAGRLFEHRSTLRAMRTFIPAKDEHGRVGYGLGLERYVFPGGIEMVGHLGTSAGYRAFVFRLPAQHVTFSMVTTTPDDPTPVLFPVLQLLAAETA